MIEPCRWQLILGPPGTGKTRCLVENLSRLLSSGMRAMSIAFLTFTRAAREEACERVRLGFGLSHSDLIHFRTIHSTAYHLLSLKPEMVMNSEHWAEFGRRFGYALTQVGLGEDSEISDLPRRSADDLMRFAHSWGRNQRFEQAGTVRLCPAPVSPAQFPLFCDRLVRFKAERGLVDFSDMLNEVLERGLRPDVDVLFVDEAQDLSPLQIAVVEQWAERCTSVYVAGDDDQAIYTFQGADPGWLLSLSERSRVEILHQSHRVPRAAFAVAQWIIGRNRARIEKPYRPTGQEGEVGWVEPGELQKLLDPDLDTLVLARNRRFLGPVAWQLFEACTPYVVEGWGGISPLSDPEVLIGLRCAQALFCKQPVDADDLAAMLKFIPSRGSSLLPHGVKQRVKELAGPLAPEFLREQLGLGELIEFILRSGPVESLVKIPAKERAYLTGLLKRYGSIPDPKIRLTTIHAAKGREADTVVVIPDMSRSTYREYADRSRGGFEAENRVAYVAVTRAMRRLVLVVPSTRRCYEYPAVVDALRGAA